MRAIVSGFTYSLLLIFVPSLHTVAQDKDWLPVTAEEIKMKTPKVESGADAEVLFWEVRITDNYQKSVGYSTTLDHHVKIKIFTERGRNEYNRVDLPFGKISDIGAETSIKDIAARTIRPDGSVISVKSGDVFEREIAKGKGIRYRAKSFVFPSVEVGSLIEYRWREVRNNAISNYLRLQFAREIPVQYVKYFLKPVSFPGFSLNLRVDSINVNSGFVKDKGDFYSSTMLNVPSFKEEPFMPSEYAVRPWVLVFYDQKTSNTPPETYWRNRGRQTYEYHESWLSFNEQIKRAALQIVGDSQDELEQVRRIYSFCRKEIVNIDDDFSRPSENVKNVKPNKTSADVLVRKAGTSHDIDMLFGAMLNAISFDARVANVSLRTDPKFNKRITNGYFNRTEVIAARIGGAWKFFNPASRYIPFGSLPWSAEGETALISDPNEPFFVETPITPPDKSKKKVKAAFRLEDDGSIEGEVRIEYTGHLAGDLKEKFDISSFAEREKTLSEMIKKQVSDSAVLSLVSIENATDPDTPLVYTFRLRVPAYAEITGKRFIFVPNVFTKNPDNKFVGNDRRYNLKFDYAWSEEDEITYKLPGRYSPESAGPPRIIDTRDCSNAVKLNFSAGNSVLEYSRFFAFGKDGILDFDRLNYQTIKQLFESVQDASGQAIILSKDVS